MGDDCNDFNGMMVKFRYLNCQLSRFNMSGLSRVICMHYGKMSLSR